MTIRLMISCIRQIISIMVRYREVSLGIGDSGREEDEILTDMSKVT